MHIIITIHHSHPQIPRIKTGALSRIQKTFFSSDQNKFSEGTAADIHRGLFFTRKLLSDLLQEAGAVVDTRSTKNDSSVGHACVELRYFTRFLICSSTNDENNQLSRPGGAACIHERVYRILYTPFRKCIQHGTHQRLMLCVDIFYPIYT